MIFLPSAKFLYRPQLSVAPWTPLSLGNTVLYGWYKADAGLSVSTDGASVAAWNDQSGNGKHLSQATPANRMTFRTAANGIGGLPALQSAATTTTVLAQSLSEPDFAGNSGFSFYIVMTQDTYSAASQYTGGFSVGVTGGSSGIHHFCNHPSRIGEVLIRYDNLGDPTLSAYTKNPVVIKVSRGTSISDYEWKATYDSLRTPSVTTTLPLLAGFRVGANYIGSVGGKIAEVIVCNKELDTTEEASLDAYFRSRYGFGLYYGADLPVANPALWLDASRSDSLYVENTLVTPVTTDNGPVGGWKDLSGNNRHALQSGTNRPTWRTPINGQNGLGVTSFNGTTASFSVAMPFSTPYTVLIAAKQKRATGVDRILNGQDLGSSTTRLWLGSYLGNYGGQVSTASGSWTGGSLTYSPTTSLHNIFKIFGQTNDGTGTGLVPYVSGTALTGVQGGMTSFTNMLIGAGPSAQYGLFDLGELLIYPFVLNSTQLASVNAYLSAKWGT